jgi:hypothetical protein
LAKEKGEWSRAKRCFTMALAGPHGSVGGARGAALHLQIGDCHFALHEW